MAPSVELKQAALRPAAVQSLGAILDPEADLAHPSTPRIRWRNIAGTFLEALGLFWPQARFTLLPARNPLPSPISAQPTRNWAFPLPRNPSPQIVPHYCLRL